MRSVIVLALAPWLALVAQDAQDRSGGLRIAVVEGEGMTYAPGGRATRGVTVEVTDENGKNLPGATVTFRLPANGASGVFPGGSRSESVATGADGRASVWGVEWNHTPGPVEITIRASKGAARAATVAHVTLSKEVGQPRASSGSGGGHKVLWIALVAIGGASGAVVGLAERPKANGSAGATAAAVNAPLIGSPTITIGHP